ncbi:MAG: signal peptide prediction [Burkholderiaceae bacterium]
MLPIPRLPQPLHLALRIARCAWAAPCTLLGVCLFAPALLVGARARIVDGCIEIALARRKPGRIWVRRLPFNAITFGHLICAVNAAELVRLRRHERAHVAQYERWGALFLVAYPAASLWQWASGRRAYVDNVFEVQAREAASEAPR